MARRLPGDVLASEITPENVYLNRRTFLKAMGIAAATAAVPKWVRAKSDFDTSEAKTPFEDITHYNNFYEFGTSKTDPAKYAGSLKTRPWTVRIDGECKKPRTYDIDDLIKQFPVEERVYRLRCVEAWSMVIPWTGMPLAAVLKRVEPTAKAKFVAFTTLHDPEQMPGQKSDVLQWPYVEGLRMDEAMNPLSMLATGLYGKCCPTRTAPPSVWSFLGNTDSRTSNRLSASASSKSNRRRLGTSPRRESTGSIRTSIRRSTIRAGARRGNAVLGSCSSVRP